LNPPPSAVRSATPPPHPEAAKSEPPKPATTAAGAKPAASTHTRWIVQVGSFSSKARARALVANLKSGGYKATLSEVHSGGQVLYRVRLAPETERARANELSARLVREGHRAVVVPES
jgi:DedD protein